MPYGLFGDYPPYRDFPWLLLLVLLALLALFIYWLKKDKPSLVQVFKPVKPKRNVWQETLAAFESPIEDIRKYYFISSEKLKGFTGFAEKTTNEIKHDQRYKSWQQADLLIAVLEMSDPVKFAKYLPTSSEVKEYQSLAGKFLEANRPEVAND